MLGDTVVVRKAGDIIPEVVRAIVEKRNGTQRRFTMPSVCPSCGEPVYYDESEAAAARCTNSACPAQLSRSIEHFASKGAMNIEGEGLHVLSLSLESGQVTLCGHVDAIFYENRTEKVKKGFFSRLTR